MKRQNNDNLEPKDFKRLFSVNSILSKIITYSAYIILSFSILILVYLSFIETLGIEPDWRILTLFTIATVLLAWNCWSMFYKKHYEEIMQEDVDKQETKQYSIHSRYYVAVKDWNDTDLQLAIDKFNEEYTARWLRWVEKTTGVPIESCDKVEVDENGNPKLDDNGQPIIVHVKGIKDLRYKGFYHKIIMWRIKHHVYPKSGYTTAMELMSLLSYQESNFNKRNLKADKQFFTSHAITKFISLLLSVTIVATIIPTMIQGEYWTAILRLIFAIFTVVSSVLTGAINGVKGARLKLSVVEDAASDLERWAGKKPLLEPYKEVKPEEEKPAEPVKEPETPAEKVEEIFKQKIPK